MDFYKITFLIAIAPWLLMLLVSFLPSKDDADGAAMLTGLLMVVAVYLDVACFLAALIKWLF